MCCGCWSRWCARFRHSGSRTDARGGALLAAAPPCERRMGGLAWGRVRARDVIVRRPEHVMNERAPRHVAAAGFLREPCPQVGVPEDGVGGFPRHAAADRMSGT